MSVGGSGFVAGNLAAPVVDFFLYLPNLSLCNSDSLLIFW